MTSISVISQTDDATLYSRVSIRSRHLLRNGRGAEPKPEPLGEPELVPVSERNHGRGATRGLWGRMLRVSD